MTKTFYILRKEYSTGERSQLIYNICGLCEVDPVTKDTIEKAITSGFAPDLEDAIQIQCAVESDCEYFITRDQQLFAECPVRTLLPHELISELSL